MRITFIGHASLLIEANGPSIVSDPWWNGPCFGAQWWPYPMPYLEAVHDRRVDCDYGTASHFPNRYVRPGKDRAATAAMRQAYFKNDPPTRLNLHGKLISLLYLPKYKHQEHHER